MELLTITFNREKFKSETGIKLLTEFLETNPNSYTGLLDAVEKIKDTVDITIKSVIVSVIVVNSVMGSSGEFMFAFVNTL